jgi:hypothetical protein
MGIIKIYHDKKWTLQFLDALYNSIDIDSLQPNKMLECNILFNKIIAHTEISPYNSSNL